MAKDSHPDADVHPVATGQAKKIVDRVWTILEEKKIPFQYIEVNPYQKPESLMKLNPRGLVPTLQYDNKPLFESSVIGQFIEEAYPDYGTSILPADVYDRAQMRIWADYVSTRIVPSFHRFLQAQPSTTGDRDENLNRERSQFHEHLKVFTKEMHPTGPFFCGNEPMLVDFTMGPWALRLWVFDNFKGGLQIPPQGQGGDNESTWERWRAWYAAIESRPSFANTMSDREHYLPIYQRYADDKAQSEVAKATRAGRGLP